MDGWPWNAKTETRHLREPGELVKDVGAAEGGRWRVSALSITGLACCGTPGRAKYH
jgi:hypothetical protein